MRRSSPLSNSVFQKFYTGGEEIMNSVTHGVGVLLSIAGLVLNVVFGVLSGDPWKFAGGLTFGITLILLFTCSTLYHAIINQIAKAVRRAVSYTHLHRSPTPPTNTTRRAASTACT